MKKERKIFLIFGKTGSGKTTLVKKILKDYKRLIIIDAMLEYNEGIIFYDLFDFTDYLRKHHDNEKPFTYILRFTSDEEIEKFFDLAFEIQNYCLVLEEAEKYISPYTKRSNFLKLVSFGRHKAISIIGVARRTTELNTSLRSQTDTIFSFVQTFPKDLEIMETLGLTDLDKLPKYEFKRIDY